MTQAHAAQAEQRSGDQFDAFVVSMQAHADEVLADGQPLFRVETPDDLFDLYLEELPPADRQHHNCSACRHFMRDYGNLVTVRDDGTLRSVFWSTGKSPNLYGTAAWVLNKAVRAGRIEGVALPSVRVWGTAITGPWTHFAAVPPADVLHTHGPERNRSQAEAAKLHDYQTLQAALGDFTQPMVQQAFTLLSSGAMYQSERFIGPMRFLMDRVEERQRVRHGEYRNNLVWRAVATAPDGFCHPRTTIIGTLLEDLAAGLPYAAVARKFEEKVHPLRYMRPQAAPAAGNIAVAERLVEQLGIASALKRRFARLEEIETLWRPPTPEPEAPGLAAGVFSHLVAKSELPPKSPLDIPAQDVTWEKFFRTVLPTARKIEAFVGTGLQNFCALTMQSDPEAKPILQWDSEARRNPFSWYVYVDGSYASQWNLPAANVWVPVTAIAPQPSLWDTGAKSEHHGKSVLFVLDGCRDTKPAGLALFPVLLQASLHAVRATIEAHSNDGVLEGAAEATACGLRAADGSHSPVMVRVTGPYGVTSYRIGDWD